MGNLPVYSTSDATGKPVSDAQCGWGDCRDPHGILDTETFYTVLQVIHTTLAPQLVLAEYPGDVWNSLCFEIVKP